LGGNFSISAGESSIDMGNLILTLSTEKKIDDRKIITMANASIKSV